MTDTPTSFADLMPDSFVAVTVGGDPEKFHVNTNLIISSGRMDRLVKEVVGDTDYDINHQRALVLQHADASDYWLVVVLGRNGTWHFLETYAIDGIDSEPSEIDPTAVEVVAVAQTEDELPDG